MSLDCGAGIGRVSKRLLLPLFREVDLIEQNPLFLERSQEYLVSRLDLETAGYFFVQGEAFKRVGKSYPLGLQVCELSHVVLITCCCRNLSLKRIAMIWYGVSGYSVTLEMVRGGVSVYVLGMHL